MLFWNGAVQRSRMPSNTIVGRVQFSWPKVPLVGVGTLVQGTTYVWEAVNTSSGFK